MALWCSLIQAGYSPERWWWLVSLIENAKSAEATVSADGTIGINLWIYKQNKGNQLKPINNRQIDGQIDPSIEDGSPRIATTGPSYIDEGSQEDGMVFPCREVAWGSNIERPIEDTWWCKDRWKYDGCRTYSSRWRLQLWKTAVFELQVLLLGE